MEEWRHIRVQRGNPISTKVCITKSTIAQTKTIQRLFLLIIQFIESQKEYAKMLLDNGYVEEVDERKRFVNIFDEIDNKLSEYNNELYTLQDKG